MPKRTDIRSIAVLGSGPIVIGQACEFDYSGTQACRVLRREGYRVVLVNSNPATIMTDPEFADATYVEPLVPEVVEQILEKERPDALLPTVGGQTGINLALALARARHARAAGHRAARRRHRRPAGGRGPRAVQAGDGGDRAARLPLAATPPRSRRPRRSRSEIGFPIIVRAVLHARRRGRRHLLQPRRARRGDRRGARGLAGAQGPARGGGARLEGVRARGHPRPPRQRHRRLLGRELRRHGRPHRRLDHRGAAADADRPRVPGDARRRLRGHPPGRRGDRRLEHPVRRRPGDRRAHRHRDEPARLAQLGARLQGHRLPDRQGRRAARGRLHARRDPQRHHRQDLRRLRAHRSTTRWSRSRAGRSRSSPARMPRWAPR